MGNIFVSKMNNKDTTPLVSNDEHPTMTDLKKAKRPDRIRNLMVMTVGGALIFAVGFVMFNPFRLMTFFATFLGAMVMLKVCLAIGLAVWELYFMKQKDIQARYGKDSWAVVTGGSDGIGLAIAHRLAMNKMNIVLVARNETKLKEKVKEIKQKYKVKVEYRVADFGKGLNPEFYSSLASTVEDLDVSLLVNNVGIGAKEMHIATTQQVWDQGIINMVPQYMMTKVFLEKFKGRTSRCGVIDISSLASLGEFANSGLYGGTKAFNRAFTQCLQEKYGADFGIDFLTIKPGFVLTNICDGDKITIKGLFKNKADNFMVFTPEVCAEKIINCLGNVCESYGCHIKIGYLCDAMIWITSAIQVTSIMRMLGFKR